MLKQRTLKTAVKTTGVGVHTGETVKSLVTRGGRVMGVKTDVRKIEADAVVLATGAWAPELLRPFGIELPV